MAEKQRGAGGTKKVEVPRVAEVASVHRNNTEFRVSWRNIRLILKLLFPLGLAQIYIHNALKPDGEPKALSMLKDLALVPFQIPLTQTREGGDILLEKISRDFNAMLWSLLNHADHLDTEIKILVEELVARLGRLEPTRNKDLTGDEIADLLTEILNLSDRFAKPAATVHVPLGQGRALQISRSGARSNQAELLGKFDVSPYLVAYLGLARHADLLGGIMADGNDFSAHPLQAYLAIVHTFRLAKEDRQAVVRSIAKVRDQIAKDLAQVGPEGRLKTFSAKEPNGEFIADHETLFLLSVVIEYPQVIPYLLAITNISTDYNFDANCLFDVGNLIRAGLDPKEAEKIKNIAIGTADRQIDRGESNDACFATVRDAIGQDNLQLTLAWRMIIRQIRFNKDAEKINYLPSGFKPFAAGDTPVVDYLLTASVESWTLPTPEGVPQELFDYLQVKCELWAKSIPQNKVADFAETQTWSIFKLFKAAFPKMSLEQKQQIIDKIKGYIKGRKALDHGLPLPKSLQKALEILAGESPEVRGLLIYICKNFIDKRFLDHGRYLTIGGGDAANAEIKETNNVRLQLRDYLKVLVAAGDIREVREIRASLDAALVSVTGYLESISEEPSDETDRLIVVANDGRKSTKTPTQQLHAVIVVSLEDAAASIKEGLMIYEQRVRAEYARQQAQTTANVQQRMETKRRQDYLSGVAERLVLLKGRAKVERTEEENVLDNQKQQRNELELVIQQSVADLRDKVIKEIEKAQAQEELSNLLQEGV